MGKAALGDICQLRPLCDVLSATDAAAQRARGVQAIYASGKWAHVGRKVAPWAVGDLGASLGQEPQAHPRRVHLAGTRRRIRRPPAPDSARKTPAGVGRPNARLRRISHARSREGHQGGRDHAAIPSPGDRHRKRRAGHHYPTSPLVNGHSGQTGAGAGQTLQTAVQPAHRTNRCHYAGTTGL